MKSLNDLQEVGMNVDMKYQVAYKEVSGFKFMVQFSKQQRQYVISTTVKTENEVGALSQAIEEMGKNELVNWSTYQDYTVALNIKAHKALTAHMVMDFIQALANILVQNNYTSYCRFCGQDTNVDVCIINGQSQLMCNECLSKVETTQQPVKKANAPLGILGALIGSFIGVIIWVIVYKLGYVAGITGFILAIGCFKGYELLGGAMDKKGVFISLAIAIIMLAMAELISLGLEIYGVFSDYYAITLVDAFMAIPDFLGEGEILAGVVKDLLFGYIFMGAASFSFIKNIFMAVNQEGDIKKLG